MLRQVADGVLTHQSEFMQTNTVVVQGAAGVLLVDPGVRGDELACLAGDLRELGQPVVVGFSTHPHWDHLLWHAELGDAPRYGTARCAATVRERLPDPETARARVAPMMPPGLAEHVPLDGLGNLSGLPADGTTIPWDGPRVRVIEHRAHAPGHAALLIAERRVLVAGDMLSDVLIPFLDLSRGADACDDYLAALQLLEDAAGDVDVVVPGHGSPGAIRPRLDQDRAYVQALRDGPVDADARLTSAYGRDFLPAVHERHVEHLAGSRD